MLSSAGALLVYCSKLKGRVSMSTEGLASSLVGSTGCMRTADPWTPREAADELVLESGTRIVACASFMCILSTIIDWIPRKDSEVVPGMWHPQVEPRALERARKVGDQ